MSVAHGRAKVGVVIGSPLHVSVIMRSLYTLFHVCDIFYHVLVVVLRNSFCTFVLCAI